MSIDFQHFFFYLLTIFLLFYFFSIEKKGVIYDNEYLSLQKVIEIF